MKKIIFAAALALSACANADYLYWMVEQNSSEPDAVEFMYARIAVSGEGVDAGTYLSDGSGNSRFAWSGFSESALTGYNTLAGYVDLAAYGADGYSFAVELYNTANEVVGVGNVETYNNLKKFVYGDMQHTGIDPWVVNTLQAVPEPTSGMLVLVGTALLALKRRKLLV